MIIAIPYKDGNVFQHFGHTEAFKFFIADETKVYNAFILDTNGQGHGALANFLKEHKVDVVICGGIGGGAINALANNNIRVLAGVSGSVDEVIEKLYAGTLEVSTEANCHHHEHNCDSHDCDSHSCDSHDCNNCH